METVVKMWGNSLGIRIPSIIAKNKTLSDGIAVEITETENGILISPKQKRTLSEMLEQITEGNIHAEIETGDITGNEIW
jgi:antitoxin MazE